MLLPATFGGQNPAVVKQAVQLILPALEKALPSGFRPERYYQMAVECALNPALANCQASTILSAIVKAATLGLSPVNTLAQCYFVPRNTNFGTRENPNWVSVCEFQIGYLGWKFLAENTGKIEYITSGVVREGDVFEFEYGLNPKLSHRPNSKFGDKFLYAYAVVHMIGGSKPFLVMDKAQVEHLRMKNAQSSKNGQMSGAWATDYESMAKAKVVKALIRTSIPVSAGIQDALAYDESVTRPQSLDEIKKTGEITVQPAETAHDGNARPELHQDYLDSLGMCATVQAVNEVESRYPEITNNPYWRAAVTAKKRALNGK
jgi:recombination protein RecT